jgi:single-strand DNA-binding protein
MSSVNKVILIGNLGRDPETRYMQNGDCVTNFSIATSEKWIDKQSGEKNEKTEWHNIVAFRKLGEICGQYLKKGSSIYCEGKLNTQKYTGKDGIEKYQTKITIDSMQMLGGQTNEHSEEKKAAPPKSGKQVSQVQASSGFDDDIPF